MSSFEKQKDFSPRPTSDALETCGMWNLLGMVTLGPAMKRPGGPGEPTLPGAPSSP